ncbi:MAG: cation-translocating P-type ATPase [Dialister sp.]|nr:cation-translocating P-type ATPase [Dialister sp.]MDU5889210.1 cation-translocating P-type ATPase [Dialister sp.]
MLNRWMENEAKITAVFAGISIISLVLSLSGFPGRTVLPFDIAWAAIILCGVPILTGAVKGLIWEHDVKADVLVAMALVASVTAEEYFAAGEVALIMQIGSLLEDYTSEKANESIGKLIRLSPQKAHVVREGKVFEVSPSELQAGDTVRVLAGETVPVDGKILDGETTIDQSVMTGESIPVDKKTGDTVRSGTINRFGTFTMRVEKRSEDSSLQRMIRLTKEAEENKAPIVSLADKWATWLVFGALAWAGGTWMITGEFMRAVTVLVVFCPCAFILATPTAVLAGIGNAAKYGIIIRSGSALEKLSKIKKAAFDKTGTLTCGKPEVADIVTDGCDKNELLRLFAAAESYSEHPLGKAVADSYKGNTESVRDFQMQAGQGISAVVAGKKLLAGKGKWLEEQNISVSSFEKQAQKAEETGATLIYAAVDGTCRGFFVLSDTIRSDAAQTISRLKKSGVVPLLLTGDNEAAAGYIAGQVGISEVKSGLLPEEKMRIIEDISKSGGAVCMIGDGVNDAPALTRADAGIAMGGIGSDIAIESADAVLVGDEIKRIPYLFMLTKKVMNKVNVNIVAGMIINITAVILSSAGILNPVTGALWHNFGSVFVVINAALLLQYKDK